MLVHGANLRGKEMHRKKYRDSDSRKYLTEIRENYDEWYAKNTELLGPTITPSADDLEILKQRVKLFEDYKNFIDQQHYAEKFDSRSNLHSSALEEFLYYLFKDLVKSFGEHALIGKSHAFKDIFFTAPSYSKMLNKPYAKIEKKDHDFVIGVTVQASLQSSRPGLSTIQSDNEESREQLNYILQDTPAQLNANDEKNVDLEPDITVSTEDLSEFSQQLGTRICRNTFL